MPSSPCELWAIRLLQAGHRHSPGGPQAVATPTPPRCLHLCLHGNATMFAPRPSLVRTGLCHLLSGCGVGDLPLPYRPLGPWPPWRDRQHPPPMPWCLSRPACGFPRHAAPSPPFPERSLGPESGRAGPNPSPSPHGHHLPPRTACPLVALGELSTLEGPVGFSPCCHSSAQSQGPRDPPTLARDPRAASWDRGRRPGAPDRIDSHTPTLTPARPHPPAHLSQDALWVLGVPGPRQSPHLYLQRPAAESGAPQPPPSDSPDSLTPASPVPRHPCGPSPDLTLG